METTTLMNLVRKFNFDGVSFVSIKGYTKSNGEVSDVIVNIGGSYKNMQAHDLVKLQEASANELVNDNFNLSLIESALAERIQSIVAPNERISKAQKDAYISLNKQHTILYCENTGNINISGVAIKKTIITEGVYKPTKSGAIVLAKKYIGKVLNLSTDKVRKYTITNIERTVTVRGETIEL